MLFLNRSWNNALISYFPLSLPILINLSLSTGIFPDQFKNCSVHPHLKTSNLDKDDLGNYHPVSHLSFLSKLTEKAIKLRLVDYLSTNNLLNSFQSAYIKHHSIETTLLAVHDHEQVTCLKLLDLSAAFDTVDHSILLERRTRPNASSVVNVLSQAEDITQVLASKYKDFYTSVSYNSTDMESLKNDLSTKPARNGYDEHCMISSISVFDAISKLKSEKGDGNTELTTDHFRYACLESSK